MYNFLRSGRSDLVVNALNAALSDLGSNLRLAFPQHFSFSQTSTRISITRQKCGTCFFFFLISFMSKTTVLQPLLTP